MGRFTLEMPRQHPEFARLMVGMTCESCRWEPHAAGVNRALFKLRLVSPNGFLSFSSTLNKGGGKLVQGEHTGTTDTLSKVIPTRIRSLEGLTITQAHSKTSTKNGLHADIDLVFDDGAVLTLDARPLPDAVCETDLPFEQSVGAMEVDSLHRGAPQMPKNPPEVPGFVPKHPLLRAVK
jgi:hypothetical protein